jgi:hypothetical protein
MIEQEIDMELALRFSFPVKNGWQELPVQCCNG